MFINVTIIRFYRIFFTTTHIYYTQHEYADYLLMSREYSIWNAAVASLQVWTEDLDPVTLGRATECVYTTFSTHHQVIHSTSNPMKYYLDVL